MFYNFGYVRDSVDNRDYLWRSTVQPQPLELPRTFQTRCLGPVLDQGREGKCVVFAVATLKFHQEYREHRKYYDFDPHWLYGICKTQDGIPDQEGTFIRVAMQIIQTTGYLAKAQRYRLRQDTHFPIDSYVRLTSTRQIKEALSTQGPVIFGIGVDSGIYSPDARGVLPEPNGDMVGGHAIAIVGWDDNKKCHNSVGAFRIKQSWGIDHGLKGYVWMPYTHLEQYSYDAWRTVDKKDLFGVPHAG